MPTFTDLQQDDLDVETREWLTHVLDVIEGLDIDAYVALMTDDVELRLPDGSRHQGRDAVTEALRPTWAALATLEHQELSLLGNARTVVHEAQTVSTTRDGAEHTAVGTSWLDRDEAGNITSARVYG